jgi:hypothetical protein
LTGFHKRKVERKNRTKEKYAALAKEEKLRSRKEAREERQRLAERNGSYVTRYEGDYNKQYKLK